MNQATQYFIEDNIDLIERNEFGLIYDMGFDTGDFTLAMLKAGIKDVEKSRELALLKSLDTQMGGNLDLLTEKSVQCLFMTLFKHI